MILRAAVVIVLTFTLAGCSDASSIFRSSGVPYDGPMYVEPDYVDGGLENVQAGELEGW